MPSTLGTMRTRLLPIALLAALTAALLPAVPATAASTGIVINEVESNGDVNDWVELYNAGAAAVDVSGWVLKDSTDNNPYTVPASTSIAAGGFLVIDVSGAYFGLGGSDSVRLFEGATEVATYTYAAHATITYGRCPDGTGPLAQTTASTKGTANICALDPTDVVRINEIESEGGTPGDWIELVNTGASAVDVSGLVLKDSTDNNPYTLAGGTSIPAGGYFVADVGGSYFGLGGADSARLFAADGTTLIDSYSWTAHASTTYGRCAGSIVTTAASTKGAANDCPAPTIPAVIVNEVESSGGTPGDWAELFNTEATPVDISGWVFKDGEDSHQVALPANTILAPGGFFVVDEAFFGNGLGAADSARLFLADGLTLVDSQSWTAHATTTYGICGTEFVTTNSPTKGAANDCGSPIRINEIESDAGSPGDWVELKNTGVAPVDLTGYVLKDSTDNDSYTVPAATSIPAGGYLVIDVGGALFGLGGSDSARLFSGATLVDSYTWTSHAVATTYGRCPDGTGDFATTAASTKGTVNACPGDLVTSPWPGGATVAPADDAGVFGGDLSGLAFDGDVVWAVRNGTGTLFRLVRDGAIWAPDTANGWGSGKPVHYADGTGRPDSEGVAVVDGSVFVSTERNGLANGVSRLAVLRYDVSGSAAELTATREWNLNSLLPTVGANLGLEGITWVPDSYLLDGGFIDESTSAAYDPSDYAGHGSGLFFVGVEANGAVYAFALDQGGTTANLVATIDSGLEIVADLTFDAERGGLWVVCDDTCEGRTGFFEIAGDGAFAPTTYFERPSGMANLNNEGFALAPQSECEAGVKEVLWADDANTDNHSIRTGTIDCTELTGPVAIPEEELTDAARGPVTAPATATPGQTITVGVGNGLDGESIDGWIYSTPVHLGTKVVSSADTVQLTIPTATALGVHKLAIVDADGNLIGWAAITIGSVGLASTGVNAVLPASLGLLLLLAGATFILLRRRATA